MEILKLTSRIIGYDYSVLVIGSLDHFDFHIKVQPDQVCCGHGRPCAALKALKCIGFGAFTFLRVWNFEPCPPRPIKFF